MSSGGLSEPGLHRFTVEADEGVRLDLLIAAHISLSRTQAATLIANGAVTVNARRERASYRAASGDSVEVAIPAAREPRREVVAEAIPLDVAYEDDDLLVIDKPAGMVVHPAPGHWTGTLVNALRGRGGPLSSEGGGQRAGIVHRLDKETSGLLVVARTDRAHRLLAGAMAARRIVRRYAALSMGHISADNITIDRPVARDPRDRKRMAIVSSGRTARTDAFRLARFDSTDLLRLHLHTGRTHQIRVHLASIGHPVAGDSRYGAGEDRRLALPPGRHFLHAAWLRLRHPSSGELLDLHSPLPADLRRSIAAASNMPELEHSLDPLDYFGFDRTDD